MLWRKRSNSPPPVTEEVLTVRINLPPDQKKRGPALKILLLEDRNDFSDILRDHLKSSGHQVTSVASGVEGVRHLMQAPFDLIICDMMMPNMGGEMFYWAVMRVRPGCHQRFIFFTGHRNNEALEAFFRKVNATVLYKPFKLYRLDNAIDDLVRKLG